MERSVKGTNPSRPCHYYTVLVVWSGQSRGQAREGFFCPYYTIFSIGNGQTLQGLFWANYPSFSVGGGQSRGQTAVYRIPGSIFAHNRFPNTINPTSITASPIPNQLPYNITGKITHPLSSKPINHHI